MQADPKGRVALVTGGGRGIGKSLALGFAETGHRLVLVARNSKEIESLAQEIRSRGSEAIGVAADVAKAEDVQRVFDTAALEFGSVDVLVNNAGTAAAGRIEDMDAEEWRSIIEVNLFGSYFFCRNILPGMVRRGWGRIINISSRFGKMGLKFGSAYCAAKHGVIGLTRALALETANTGVTVNAICPGAVDTLALDELCDQLGKLYGVSGGAIKNSIVEQSPQRRLFAPHEIVPIALFLASDAASCVTGEAVNASGGSVMH